jgi:glucokinase
MSGVIAGIDLGGTGSRFVVYGRDGIIASTAVATAALGAGSLERRLSRLVDTLRGLVPAGRNLLAAGIGASGPVDRAAGVIHNQETLPMFSGFPLVAALRNRMAVNVIIDNDAVTAAIAEQRLGAGQGAGHMLMVTLGTGIGAAFLVDGSPFRGPCGKHPEAGHIPIVAGVGRCYCGAEGCWEQVASRSALQAMLRPHVPLATEDRDVLASAAAAADDPLIQDVFASYGRLVGRGLAVLHSLYRPDVTILGGSAADYLPMFINGMQQAMARQPDFAVKTAIRTAALGDNAGAIGAALIGHETLQGGWSSCTRG